MVARNMATRSMVGETNSLLRLVEQRMKLKRELEEKKTNQQKKNTKQRDDPVFVPYLPKDCIFNIIVRLPLESILISRFVCKPWYGIVNTPSFVDAHSQRSEIGLIYLASVKKDQRIGKVQFSVDSKVSGLEPMLGHNWHLFDQRVVPRIMFMEIKDGKGVIKEYNATCDMEIKASCNGLIILEKVAEKGGLIVMNPVTKEMDKIPFGTKLSTRRRDSFESYGLAFCNESRRYKLVHLFQDTLRYFDCEIMDIGSGCWRGVNGPPNGYFTELDYSPVFALGALHWIPRIVQNEYMVSMAMNDEKFVKIPLPETGGAHDRILEMGRFLGFVTRRHHTLIHVWMLTSLNGEGWAKHLSISVDCPRNLVPLYRVKGDGEILFKSGGNDLYSYDHRLNVMRRIEMNMERFSPCGPYFPHVNSLVSWKI